LRPNDTESTLSGGVILFLVLQAAAADAGAASSAAARSIDDPAVPLTGFVPFGSYEANLRGAVARAQSLQGSLDGGWIVADAAGRPLYRFQLVDSGRAGAGIEGAWSDLQARSPGSGGFFSSVQQEGGRVTLRFDRGVMWVAPSTAGGFEGELSPPGDPPRWVTLKRPSPTGP
jgi:hypothetical protein